jgi:hypothetical protein
MSRSGDEVTFLRKADVQIPPSCDEGTCVQVSKRSLHAHCSVVTTLWLIAVSLIKARALPYRFVPIKLSHDLRVSSPIIGKMYCFFRI